jgi:transcriptional regulator with PAS, ATPase and Fis domain
VVVDEADSVTERHDEAFTSAPDRLRVNVLWDGGALERILPSSGSVSIGRGGDCDLHIAHTSVSRRHALLHVDPLRIEDLSSANGTRVAGRRLAPGSSALFSTEQVVELGKVVLVVHGSSSPRPPTAGEEGMQQVFTLVERVAPGTISVLIVGETGVGKEVIGERIHRASPRASKEIVRVNCAALNETLLESELFGYERGAFTGANTAKPGLLETANGGTFFLDEVGELPAPVQAKLLRVLETRQVRRLGGLRPTSVDVRFISATNRDLRQLCASRLFREDLFYRLNGVTIRIPPLRERVPEIRALASQFLASAAAEAGRAGLALSEEALSALCRYSWPGNVRQLKNVIERAALVSTRPLIEPECLELDDVPPMSDAGSPSVAPTPTSIPPSLKGELETLERQRILDALVRCGGNQTQAAKILGMSRRTLLTRLDDYGVPRPRKS